MKNIIKIIALLAFLSIGLFVVGCSSTDNSQSTGQEAMSEELYTCGMHPNVIQEGPGNCPICGMNLTPLNTPASANNTGAIKTGGEKEVLYYRAPMDPTYISPKPGKSPMGMDLVPVYAGEEAFGSTVKINPATVQNIGVRTVTVIKKDLYQNIRTVGRVDYDETKVGFVQTKFSGWIEKSYVDKTGQKVRKGDTLLEIYSPQLVTAQEEYLETFLRLKQAENESRDAAIENLKSTLISTRKRLKNFDISNAQIERLENEQIINKTLKIYSPYSGIVDKKHVQDGMEVKPGMKLYSISDVNNVWVYADVYEYETPWIQEGRDATMTLSYIPGKKFKGQVDYIYPYLDSKTRTLKVRLTFQNSDNILKPGMYANVNISSVRFNDAIAVPTEAVMFSGERNLVFIALGEGRFAPRDVEIGIESADGFYEIKEGLQAGELVVTSSQFLLDSESKLQESISKMLSSRNPSNAEADMISMDSEKSQENKIGSNPTETGNLDHDHNHQEMSDAEMSGIEDIAFGTVENSTLSYYACPMESHSYVKMNEPGSCPDCGMNLINKKESYNSDKKYYTCPMESHSYVIMEEQGNCPVCGMNTVEIKND